MKPRFPDWYAGVWLVLLAFFALLNLYWLLGASGIRVFGAAVSFERQQDLQLYRIDDTRAFVVTAHGDVSVVRYGPGFPVLRLWVGRYTPTGSVLNAANYKQGDWVFSAYPEYSDPDALNLVTGETRRVDSPEDYAALGLRSEEANRLTRERLIADGYPSLSTEQESALVFNLSFLVLFLVWSLLGLVLWWRR